MNIVFLDGYKYINLALFQPLEVSGYFIGKNRIYQTKLFYKSLTELGSYTSHDLYFRNSGTSFSINICSLNLLRIAY